MTIDKLRWVKDISPDGKYISLFDYDSNAMLVDISNYNVNKNISIVSVPKDNASWGENFIFNSRNNSVLFINQIGNESNFGWARIFTPPNFNSSKKIKIPYKLVASSYDLLPDQKTYIAFTGIRILIVSAGDMKILKTLYPNFQEYGILGCAVNPSGDKVAAVVHEGSTPNSSVWILSSSTLTREKSFSVNTDSYQGFPVSIAYSPDNKYIAVALYNLIKIYSSESGVLLKTYSRRLGSGTELNKISFSPNGKLLAAIGTQKDETIYGKTAIEIIKFDLPIGEIKINRLASADNNVQTNMNQNDYMGYDFAPRVKMFIKYIHQLNQSEDKYWTGWSDQDNIYVYKDDEYSTRPENDRNRSNNGKIKMNEIKTKYGGGFSSTFEINKIWYDPNTELVSFNEPDSWDCGKDVRDAFSSLNGIFLIDYRGKMQIRTGETNQVVKIPKSIARSNDILNNTIRLIVNFSLTVDTRCTPDNLTFIPLFIVNNAALITKNNNVLWSLK